MNIALIGGIDRLERHYQEEAVRVGVDLRVFNTTEVNIGAKLRQADALVIFTNKISHQMKKKAVSAAKSNNIPIFMHHSCGVCTLRDCLNCLIIMHDNHTRSYNNLAGFHTEQYTEKEVAA
jgi:hypothetical protein